MANTLILVAKVLLLVVLLLHAVSARRQRCRLDEILKSGEKKAIKPLEEFETSVWICPEKNFKDINLVVGKEEKQVLSITNNECGLQHSAGWKRLQIIKFTVENSTTIEVKSESQSCGNKTVQLTKEVFTLYGHGASYWMFNQPCEAQEAPCSPGTVSKASSSPPRNKAVRRSSQLHSASLMTTAPNTTVPKTTTAPMTTTPSTNTTATNTNTTEPNTNTIAPNTKTTAPNTNTPAPMTTAPNTNTTAPNTNTTAPNTNTPAPITTAPNTNTPAPMARAPNTNTTAQNTNTTAPMTTTPSTNTTAPNTNTTAPSTNTTAPNTNTTAPNTNTTAPNTNTKVPNTNTTTPNTNTTAPNTNTTATAPNTNTSASKNTAFSTTAQELSEKEPMEKTRKREPAPSISQEVKLVPYILVAVLVAAAAVVVVMVVQASRKAVRITRQQVETERSVATPEEEEVSLTAFEKRASSTTLCLQLSASPRYPYKKYHEHGALLP